MNRGQKTEEEEEEKKTRRECLEGAEGGGRCMPWFFWKKEKNKGTTAVRIVSPFFPRPFSVPGLFAPSCYNKNQQYDREMSRREVLSR